MRSIYIIFVSLFLIVASSCTERFEELNSNPNAPESVGADLLLAHIGYTVANETALSAWNEGNIVAQHTAKINFTGFDRYLWGSNGMWNDMYNILRDIKKLDDIAEETNNTNYEALALTYKSIAYSTLTDLFGDIPYSEAILGEDGNFTPVYDSQEAIYNGILADLETANNIINPNGIVQGDVIFGGDLAKWQKFINSLRIRYMMRISGRVDVSAQMQNIINTQPIMESNDDNAVMEYGASQPNTWPVHTFRVGSFDEYRLSLTAENVLTGFDDPRFFTWYRPTDASAAAGNPIYAGMPNSLSEDNASTYNGGASNVSRCSEILYEEPNGVDAILMNFSELQFILAEAAQKGMISGDAQTYYESAVQASFSYWNTEIPTDYLIQTGVAYDGQLETIMTQKWIASFLNGYEAWLDFRRTGLPTFIVPGPDNVNNDVVPVRFLYPDEQQTLNADNLSSALQAQGISTQNINEKVWWEQ